MEKEEFSSFFSLKLFYIINTFVWISFQCLIFPSTENTEMNFYHEFEKEFNDQNKQTKNS